MQVVKTPTSGSVSAWTDILHKSEYSLNFITLRCNVIELGKGKTMKYIYYMTYKVPSSKVTRAKYIFLARMNTTSLSSLQSVDVIGRKRMAELKVLTALRLGGILR